MGNKFFDPKDIDAISYVKRFMEYEGLIPGFNDEFNKDPEGTLKKYNIPLSLEDLSFLPSVRGDNGHLRMVPKYPGSAAEKYADFMEAKYNSRDNTRERCTPDNEAMKKWRARQVNRCAVEIGAAFDSFIHAPLIFELADGCSVGCKFCGLNAKKLKNLFLHTPENTELFRGVLEASKEVLGPAAGMGTLYYATEPLDNPDYELFMNDYIEIFGNTPQITTAISYKNIERLRPLLAKIVESQDIIYRFSALSEQIVRTLLESFTPQELILTEILPQFENAPSANFTKVGRNADGGEASGTISCVSGFVVNMYNKTIRLTTPTTASDKYPTGEHTLDERTFTDAEDFKSIMLDMIKKNMSNIIPPNEGIRLKDGVSFEYDENTMKFVIDKGVEFKLESSTDRTFFIKFVNSLKGDFKLKRDVIKLCLDTNEAEVKATRTELVYYILNRFWSYGIIETESGLI